MALIKCPTNCDCPFLFRHSLIISERIIKIDGIRSREVTTFVICRECSHWIGGGAACGCSYRCHAEPGGTTVVIMPLDAVGLSVGQPIS